MCAFQKSMGLRLKCTRYTRRFLPGQSYKAAILSSIYLAGVVLAPCISSRIANAKIVFSRSKRGSPLTERQGSILLWNAPCLSVSFTRHFLRFMKSLTMKSMTACICSWIMSKVQTWKPCSAFNPRGAFRYPWSQPFLLLSPMPLSTCTNKILRSFTGISNPQTLSFPSSGAKPSW